MEIVSRTERLLDSLLQPVRAEEPALALMRSHGGTGALLLAAPFNGHHLVPGDEFIVAVRARLLLLDPAGQGSRPCQNVSRTGRMCGQSVGETLARHCRNCEVGPGFVRRLHGLRDATGGWLEERHSTAAVAYE